MKRCAIYVRISDDREGRALGVDRQEADCRALAERLGLEVVEVFSDNDISASTRSRKVRPEYLRMLEEAAAGRFEIVVAATSSRVTRKPREFEDLIDLAERHGVRFEYVKSPRFDLNTADGRMMARMLAAADTAEAERTAERVTRKKLETATVGGWAGGRRPYGYEADGVTVRPAEGKVVADATDAILLGSSVRAQAARLNAAGVKTSTGRDWKPTELRKVLLRARNAGLREHQGEVIGKAAWKPLVPEEKWRALTSMLSDPARRTTPGSARRWLLSGLALCGVCDGPLIVTMLASTKNSVPSYACRDGKHVVRNAAELEKFVELVTVERLKRPDTRELVRPAAPKVDVAALAAERANLQQRLDDLADNLDLDERTLARRSQKLRERLGELGQQLAVAGRGSVLSGVVDAPDPGAVWVRLDLDRKRAIIAELMKVRVLPAKRGRPKGWRAGQSYFDPANVEIT